MAQNYTPKQIAEVIVGSNLWIANPDGTASFRSKEPFDDAVKKEVAKLVGGMKITNHHTVPPHQQQVYEQYQEDLKAGKIDPSTPQPFEILTSFEEINIDTLQLALAKAELSKGVGRS